MKLTIEQIEAGMTPNGGYRLAQLIALGYKPEKPGKWPKTGWKERLTKREVTQEQYDEFLRLSTLTRKIVNRMRHEREHAEREAMQATLF